MNPFFIDGNRRRRANSFKGLQRKQFSLESLEDRLLLTAVPNNWGILASEDVHIGDSGTALVGIGTEQAGSDSSVIGILVSAADGSDVDPGSIRVRDRLGNDITSKTLLRQNTHYAGTSSMALLRVQTGEYELVLNSENGEAGDVVCSVFLPGDTNRNGSVDLSEYELGTAYASAWRIYVSGNATLGVIEYYMQEYGIDITDLRSLYNARYDINMDGVIDASDVSIFQRNSGAHVSVEFIDLFDLVAIDHSASLAEGEVGRTSAETALSADSFSASIQDKFYQSNGFNVARFAQTSSTLSTERVWTVDCTPFLNYGEDGRFTFDASSSVFDSLALGETLTLTIDYYLDNLTFTGWDQIYQNVKGGSVTITVSGRNNAPEGAACYDVSYLLGSREWSEPVNLLAGVVDPDGDRLTPSIAGAVIAQNEYGFRTDADYSEYFIVSEEGNFLVEAGAFETLLASVPDGGKVSFSVTYKVSDPHGAFDSGLVILTVIGKNDPPCGVPESISAELDLTSGLLVPTENLLAGVVDPDGDSLIPAIVSASLHENPYGISTATDYSDCFDVTQNGVFTVDREKLTSLLEAVPYSKSVRFTVAYTVSDPFGASDRGFLNLTVFGKNDPPAAVVNPLEFTKSIDWLGNLSYTIPLNANLADPDGDIAAVTALEINGASYSAASLCETEIDGFIYTWNAEIGVLTVSASAASVEMFRWAYNAGNGTQLVGAFDYCFSDGAAEGKGGVLLCLDPDNDPAEILSSPADSVVCQNSNAGEADRTSLGIGHFVSDREGYSVDICVTDLTGRTVNVGAMSGLVDAAVAYALPGGTVEFTISDRLVNQLELDAVYTVTWTLYSGITAEDHGSFAFTVKPIEVEPWIDTVSVYEEEIGTSVHVLAQNGLTARLGEKTCISESFNVDRFTQVAAVSSLRGEIIGDFASCLTFDAGTGRFVFDASSYVFDFLKAGEVLTVTADFWLGNLRLTGYDEKFDNVKGGTITVSVTGVNDAPIGGIDYASACTLSNGVFSPSVNVMTGITDPDGDVLTAGIVSARLCENRYGISTDPDCASFFAVDANGILTAEWLELIPLLKAVPQGETVQFNIRYKVSDPVGAFTGGNVLLTVVGINDAPEGAADWETELNLTDGLLAPAVNLLERVTDPDGNRLVPVILSASISVNPYGIPTDNDYSAYFGVTGDGEFTVNREGLKSLLVSVPFGKNISFNVAYAVSDPFGASDTGSVTLTVFGKNEAPTMYVNPLRFDEAISADGLLIYTIPLGANLTDPDGDTVTVTDIVINKAAYSVSELKSLEIDGFVYSWSSTRQTLTVTASDEKVETLRWAYNAADGTPLINSLGYNFSDGVDTAEGKVFLSLVAADDNARITQNLANTSVVRNTAPLPADKSILGTGTFLSDRAGYEVAVTVTDSMGQIVNVGDMEGLIETIVADAEQGCSVRLALRDILAVHLNLDEIYTVNWSLLFNRKVEDSASFNFTITQLQVSQWVDSLQVQEGKTETSAKLLSADAFTAQIDGTEYRSETFAIDRIAQVRAVSSKHGIITHEFGTCLSFDTKSCSFTFDASSGALDFLAEGEILTLTFDLYLDDLTFTGRSETYDGIKGGTITVEVVGVNSAPEGSIDGSVTFSVETGSLQSLVNVMSTVSDPDGDLLIPSITEARALANNFGIPTNVDYTSYFSVSPDGFFHADGQRLAELLRDVPGGQTVEFTVCYQVSDPYGACTIGTVTLTSIGKNHAPVGPAIINISYSDGSPVPQLNLFDYVTDPDGNPMFPSILSVEPASLIPEGTVTINTDGDLLLDASTLSAIAASIPRDEAEHVSITYLVSDWGGEYFRGIIDLSVNGSYEVPTFHGEICDVSGGYAENVSIDLADYFTGSIAGYTVSLSGDSDILDTESPYTLDGSVLAFHFLSRSDYQPKLDFSDLAVSVIAYDNIGSTTESNVFAVSLSVPAVVTVSLACVTEEFGGIEVNTLKTGSSKCGTFYYVDAGDVPKTDYEAIAQADEYYLEIWVNDASALTADAGKFFTSIQIQLNYETDGSGITSMKLEDVYAGKYAMDSYTYYDGAVENLLKAVQLCWMFSPENVSLLEPITNGDNAFLLARLSVTAGAASSITVSGVTDPESPFVGGYYAVLTGESDSLDDSQIKTNDILAAKSSSVRGASRAEYVVDHGVYVRAVAEPTAADSAADIGVNVDYLHEWESHYAEIWVKASELETLESVSASLAFNNEYFSVAGIEFGSAFSDGSWSWNPESGLVENISAVCGSVTGDGYLLLARVRFEAAEGCGVLWNESMSPVALTWALTDAQVTTDTGVKNAYRGIAASSDLWANPYDVNDDGVIDVQDFVAFANEYGENSTENYTGSFFDFNRDGRIDVRDFTALARVYGTTKQDVIDGNVELAFPESFTRRYIGSTLDGDNTELVGKIYDAAAETWADALGSGKFNATIVVKDLPNGQLAAAQVTETDPETGLPVRGTIYLDDNAAGNRWSTLLTIPESGSTRYDLYSVIMHELGHLYGFDAGNAAYLSAAGRFDWLSADGHSIDKADLMYPVLEPGVRKELTSHDLAVVAAVRAESISLAESVAIDSAYREFDSFFPDVWNDEGFGEGGF